MPLEFRKNGDGTLRSHWWYGRYEINRKRYCDNLGIKIAGKPPAPLSLRLRGDDAFEKSRTLAEAKLADLVDEARYRNQTVHLVERIYQIKTGEKLQSVALDALPHEWARLPRKRPLCKTYAGTAASALRRFAAFVKAQNPQARDMADVTRHTARLFLEEEAKRGITAKTWNEKLKVLRTAYKKLNPDGGFNPFHGVPARETETVFRKPFTPEELKAITEAACDDDFTRPLIVTGICTAMRCGDCCCLRWKDVDMARRFIAVKTGKTGVTVSVPIFPMLYDELAKREVKGEYVFPEQAKMYRANGTMITRRVRTVFAAAGFRDPDGDAAENGGAKDGAQPFRGEIHAERKNGLHKASIRDFHSFRVTWVTLALIAGVPLELVQKVTGHQTTNIVLKHYFQPGREDFRRALQSAMPALLTNGEKTPRDEMREILERMTAETAEQDKVRLMNLLRKLG